MAQLKCDFCKVGDGEVIYRDRNSRIQYALVNRGKNGGYWLFPSGHHIRNLWDVDQHGFDLNEEDRESVRVTSYGISTNGWDQWFCDSCARKMGIVNAEGERIDAPNQFNQSHEKVRKKVVRTKEPKPETYRKKDANKGGVMPMFDGPVREIEE